MDLLPNQLRRTSLSMCHFVLCAGLVTLSIVGCDGDDPNPLPVPNMQPIPNSEVLDAAPVPDLAPIWSDMAEAIIENADGGLNLQWSGASDVHEVTGYRVEWVGVLVAQVDGTETALIIPTPLGIASHTFRVAAGDASNQWTMGPSVVYVVNDDALFVLPAAGEVQRCEGIHAGAVAALPAELLAGGLFVTAEGNRVENYVTSEGDACPARRAIGTPSLRLRRLTTFVGME